MINLNKIQKDTKIAKFLKTFHHENGNYNLITNTYKATGKYNSMYLGKINDYIDDMFVLNNDILKTKENNSIFISQDMDTDKIKNKLQEAGVQEDDIIASNSLEDIPFDVSHPDFLNEVLYTVIKNKTKKEKEQNKINQTIVIYMNYLFRALNLHKERVIKTDAAFYSFYEEYKEQPEIFLKELYPEMRKEDFGVFHFEEMMDKYPEYKDVVFKTVIKLIHFTNRNNKKILEKGKHYLFKFNNSDDVVLAAMFTRLGGFCIDEESRIEFGIERELDGSYKAKIPDEKLRKIMTCIDLKGFDIEGLGVLACTEIPFSNFNCFYNDEDLINGNYEKESLYSFYSNSSILIYRSENEIFQEFLKLENKTSDRIMSYLLKDPDHRKLTFIDRYKIFKSLKV